MNTRELSSKGVNDDREIQAAINAVGVAGGGKVLLRAGTYQITSSIIIGYSNVWLCGESVGSVKIICDSSMNGNTPAVSAFVSTADIARNLLNNTSVGDTTVTVSPSDAATFSAGDYVILASNQPCDNESPQKHRGEIHKITAVLYA